MAPKQGIESPLVPPHRPLQLEDVPCSPRPTTIDSKYLAQNQLKVHHSPFSTRRIHITSQSSSWAQRMSPPPNPAKRRRLTAIHKPFRSPLQPRNPAHANNTSTPSRLTTRRSLTSPLPARSNHHSSLKSNHHALIPTSQGHRPKLRYPSDPLNPTAHALEQSLTALRAQLATAESQIETLSRAVRIRNAAATEASADDTRKPGRDLPALIAKWRSIAQTAADELFPSFKERASTSDICRTNEGQRAGFPHEESGNMAATLAGFTTGFETDTERAEILARIQRIRDGVDEDGRPVGLAEREERAMVLERIAGEQESGGATGGEEVDMGAMLRVLNVDFGTIGWDAERLDWVA